MQVYAQAYDNPIPGYHTKTVGNLRLFEATPVTEFDLDAFNEGSYDKAVLERRKAEDISAVLYPNDATEYGKELRLKQQVFFVSASLQVRQAFPLYSGPQNLLCCLKTVKMVYVDSRNPPVRLEKG